MDFSDGQNLLPPIALGRGPDVLRPSSVNARYGRGQTAFFFTRYPDDNGKRLHAFSAGEGHERHITDPEILQGFFGPNLEKITPDITYTRTIYSDERDPDSGGYKELGTEKSIDHWKVRELAMKDNLIGRYGHVGGKEALMLWSIPPEGGWDLLNDLIDELHVGKDARIVNVGSELGPVWKFKEKYNEAKASKKALAPADQDMERIRMLSQYHRATGAEKEALKKQYGFGQGKLSYPDTSKMSPEEIETYPWKRGHWRMKARQAGLPDPFDYGEATTLRGFARWLRWLEGSAA